MKTFQELVDTSPHTIQRKLEQLKFLRERPDFHPEKSCFEHIRIVTERLIQTKNVDLILAGVLHDICKLDTVKENPKTGWPTSPGHDTAAYNLIAGNEDLKQWILHHGGNASRVAQICLYHMRFHQLGDMRLSKREAQIEEWKKMEIFDLLKVFGAADNMLEEFDLNNLEKSWKTL